MRRKWVWGLTVVMAASFGVWWLGVSTAQQVGNGGLPKKDAVDPLPIKQVILFNSGVGYFQREGDVQGDARIDLSFPTSEVNDLLKSLVLQDLGKGRISTVNYDSQDPIDKILRSFALDLNNNPSFAQILNQARGEKIELNLLDKDKQLKLTGAIVGMEIKRKPAGKDQVVDAEYLNLSDDSGLHSIPLDAILGVRFLNPLLESEFQRALRVLASSHDTQKKVVSLGFSGQGKRAVRVGYVVERPIWKTTYRLRIEPDGKVSLQGWALVENTSDDDWNDVRMVLVSGRPISFKMNLYEPLYLPRPTVEPELFASLRPPVYAGAMTAQDPQRMAEALQKEMPREAWGNLPPAVRDQLLRQNAFNQMQNPFNIANPMNPGQAPMQQRLDQQQNRLTFEELQERRKQQVAARDEAKTKGSAIAMNFKEGIQSVASAEEIGDYYQYVLDQKITLSRQKSAMLPIIDQMIDGQKLSIYNEAVHSKYPLLGLRLKNTSGQPLTQGPITVYDVSTYAGDTRILDLQPNEERLLSYALDQSTEVKSDIKSTPSPDMHFKIGESNLTANYKYRQTRTYMIKNRSTHDRLVVLEHPIRSDWTLVEPKKPSEQTRGVYRFQVKVPAGKVETFDVVEDQSRVDQHALHGGQPLYVANSGIQIKALTQVSEEKLMGLKIRKGLVLPTLKQRESKTYFIQNHSDIARTFTIDHIIRAGWVRLTDGEPQKGPDVYRFDLAVEKEKTNHKEVVEEKTYQAPGKLAKDLPEAKIREYLASAVPSDAVKKALGDVLAKSAKLVETQKKLSDLEKQLKAISDDQGRLRSNLQIIPQTSDHYKTFLEKFVKQETEIEGLQKHIRETSAALLSLTKENESFLAALNAD
jgi:hypothetical protein